jgi:hypothetical protein
MLHSIIDLLLLLFIDCMKPLALKVNGCGDLWLHCARLRCIARAPLLSNPPEKSYKQYARVQLGVLLDINHAPPRFHPIPSAAYSHAGYRKRYCLVHVHAAMQCPDPYVHRTFTSLLRRLTCPEPLLDELFRCLWCSKQTLINTLWICPSLFHYSYASWPTFV